MLLKMHLDSNICSQCGVMLPKAAWSFRDSCGNRVDPMCKMCITQALALNEVDIETRRAALGW